MTSAELNGDVQSRRLFTSERRGADQDRAARVMKRPRAAARCRKPSAEDSPPGVEFASKDDPNHRSGGLHPPDHEGRRGRALQAAALRERRSSSRHERHGTASGSVACRRRAARAGMHRRAGKRRSRRRTIATDHVCGKRSRSSPHHRQARGRSNQAPSAGLPHARRRERWPAYIGLARSVRHREVGARFAVAVGASCRRG